jgi:NADH dehydrogenase (ubiquinone) flavoprotein 1
VLGEDGEVVIIESIEVILRLRPPFLTPFEVFGCSITIAHSEAEAVALTICCRGRRAVSSGRERNPVARLSCVSEHMDQPCWVKEES